MWWADTYAMLRTFSDFILPALFIVGMLVIAFGITVEERRKQRRDREDGR